MPSLARRVFLRSLEGVRGGHLEVVCPDHTYSFGEKDSRLEATIAIHDERFFSRALLGGDVGIGESYMDGDWSSPDLVSVIRLAVRNINEREEENRLLSAARRGLDALRHRWRANTLLGSRKNIRAHYDLGNEFFRLFLDDSLIYSCAYYQWPDDSLERAQIQKLDRICRKLRLAPEDHVLEIGTGWGAFALHAARYYGCRVTTTTISRKQYAHCAELFARQRDLQGRLELLEEDYRHVAGKFDKIVSIEMFEGVGYENYDTFFGACDRLLKPEGTALLQLITISDQRFPAYRRRCDWIQKHIFPGSQLASLAGVLASLARATRMAVYHAENIGLHYAPTLAEWRSRLRGRLREVRALGFDDRFIRMWDYYLAYCEGGFRERYIGDYQLLLTKLGNPRLLMEEPWREESPQQLTLPCDPVV